jgi:hypothetical protein
MLKCVRISRSYKQKGKITLPQPGGHWQAPLTSHWPPFAQVFVGNWQLKHTGHSGHSCLFEWGNITLDKIYGKKEEKGT